MGKCLTFERRYGFRNFKEVREYMKEFNIIDLLDNITTPTLTLVGSGEGDMAMNQAKMFYDKVSGPKDIHIFTEDEGADAHCQVANSGLMLAVIFDWLERIFIEY
jgi:esterase/lipase